MQDNLAIASMLQSANADPHLSLVMPVPDGSELRFLATDKTMDQDQLIDTYEELFTDDSFNLEIFEEMKRHGWEVF